ncbi:hypothetical protein, partial [Vibrio cholerae]
IHKLLWRNWAIYKIFNFHFYFPLKPKLQLAYNARLRGWQRITLNSITTTETTAAQWDWKRHALTVPLEAFVSRFSDPV